ncbi:MAG TPA: ribosome maturation factor RimM [Tissierellaceae bacterium]|jgi:16S rRNA processing protein RimM|nr:ribosome maturation factor RimM [Tissierellaceae bacterium]
MEYTVIGKLTGTHGIKGDLKVFPLTDSTERFFELEKAYVGENKIKVHVSGVKLHKGMVLLRFKGLEDINKVLDFKDEYLYVDEEDKVRLPENHYFISDLVGCRVYDKSETFIGELTDVIQNSANDVYVVTSDTGKEYLIPAVEAFIASVDVVEKIIIVDPIEGMIE